MTQWQTKFAVEFWTDQLRQNKKLDENDLIRFIESLTEIVTKRKPSAICTVSTPQMHLLLALKSAELPEDSLPLSHINLVFISDGTIQIYEDDKWTKHQEPT